MKSWPNVATKQLQSRKKVRQKYRDIACKANFSVLIWDTPLKFMLQHPTVRLDWKQSKYPSKELLSYDFFAQVVDWCLKDCTCDKQSLQTTLLINAWKSALVTLKIDLTSKLLWYVPLTSGMLRKVSFWTVWNLRWLPALWWCRWTP